MCLYECMCVFHRNKFSMSSKLRFINNDYSSLSVFLYSTTQEMIFDLCVKDIVKSVLGGYNGSIIASGQTGINM